ncbi:hypothetical protein ACKU3K_028120 [Klebsiella pneumoniae]
MSKRIRAAGKAPTAERVISGLDFGFWTNFLTKNYDEPRNRSLLWPQLLPSVFPGYPPSRAGKEILPVSVTCEPCLAHHWKQSGNSGKEDPVTGAPDYNRPVYGLQASLQLLRRAWKDMLEALSWLSPARHAAFLAEGHHLRFEALATHDGFAEFHGRHRLRHDLNVRRSKEIRKLLRGLGQQKIIRLTSRTRIIGIIGPDFIRTSEAPPLWGRALSLIKTERLRVQNHLQQEVRQSYLLAAYSGMHCCRKSIFHTRRYITL